MFGCVVEVDAILPNGREETETAVCVAVAAFLHQYTHEKKHNTGIDVEMRWL